MNFPACPLQDFKGILYDRTPAQKAFFDDNYKPVKREDGSFEVVLEAGPVYEAEEGSDIKAVLDGYISIGILENKLLCRKYSRFVTILRLDHVFAAFQMAAQIGLDAFHLSADPVVGFSFPYDTAADTAFMLH